MERIQTNDLVSYLVDRYPIEKEKHKKDVKIEKSNPMTSLREYYGGNIKNKGMSCTTVLMWIIIAVLVIFILLMSCKK